MPVEFSDSIQRHMYYLYNANTASSAVWGEEHEEPSSCGVQYDMSQLV